MFYAQTLVLYKNRPALVLEVRDRIEIGLEDGSSLRVRDKDLVFLHGGPVKVIPRPAEGGDFETARRMLMPEAASLSWAELAELVFGDSGPAQVLACWLEATKGLLFRLEGGMPVPLDDEAVAKEGQKRARKEGEAAERAAFIERAKRIKTFRRKAGAAEEEAAPPAFEESDGRFFAEIEALAYGKSAKSRTCAELGISENSEAAHAFLIAVGHWDEMVNPHPHRALCSLAAPKIELGPDLGDLSRVDLTGMESWAIDNPWSKDPDDAIAWDGSSVWVHVADPASAILPDSDVDKEALARGSTLYLPELTAPMLPDEALRRYGLGLSRQEAGSDPTVSRPTQARETAQIGELSPALSFRIDLAADGSITGVEACASTVRVRRCSYGEADRLVDEGKAPVLAALAELAARRGRRRAENGAVEIDIPEVRITVEGAGTAREIRIESIPKNRSSGLVREMMLLAGEAAARWAFERGLAFPFYGQEAPSDMGPSGAPESLALQFARRRLMRAGMWGPSPSAHRGLGLPFYAQITSPLRRYQDLLGHMQLRAFLARATNVAGVARAPLDGDEVSRRCALAQAASAATRAAERASDQHWTLAYLARHPNWTGDAIVGGGAGPGAWQVYLPELGLETRLRLGPDRALDEKISVRLVRADVAALESSFEETH
ncbi:MAG: RNB domain-containing ribonuclease [Rectinemataceae bacterium]|jgi:exoribonuclease-2